MIEKMLDTAKNPDCQQCLYSAEFLEDIRQVYTRRQSAFLIETIQPKNIETQAKAKDTRLASAIQQYNQAVRIHLLVEINWCLL